MFLFSQYSIICIVVKFTFIEPIRNGQTALDQPQAVPRKRNGKSVNMKLRNPWPLRYAASDMLVRQAAHIVGYLSISITRIISMD